MWARCNAPCMRSSRGMSASAIAARSLAAAVAPISRWQSQVLPALPQAAPAPRPSRPPPPPPHEFLDYECQGVDALASPFAGTSASSGSKSPGKAAQSEIGVDAKGSTVFFTELSRQLLDLDARLVPTEEQHARKRWLESTLKPLLERHTGGVLHTFGSCANGFWMNGSDVDACLVLRRCTQRPSWLTKLHLVDCLVRREKIGIAQVVRGARVPVAKVQDREGVELCDVSVNNVAALENSRFVQTLARLDPRVRTLGRVIKHWASRRQINNRSEGTLSTYTLILKLFYFLQLRDPPVLPLVTDLLVPDIRDQVMASLASPEVPPARMVNSFVSDPELCEASGELRTLPFLTDLESIRDEDGVGRFPGLGKNEEGLGELLHGFFQLWGDAVFRGGDEGRGQTVYVFDGTREENDLGVLAIRCPLTGKNVNPFTISVWQAIHAEFERAALLLRQGRTLAEICEAAEEPPAGLGSARSAPSTAPRPPPIFPNPPPPATRAIGSSGTSPPPPAGEPPPLPPE